MMTKWGWFRIIILLTCIDNAGDDRGATAAATADDNDDRSDRAPQNRMVTYVINETITI